MKRLLLFALLTVVVFVIGSFAQSKLFAITGDETSITITFADAAAKQTFLDAMATRGSYQEQRNDKGEITLTKEDFVFNELTQFFGDAIVQQRTQAAIQAAIGAVPKEDIPEKKRPRAAAIKPQ